MRYPRIYDAGLRYIGDLRTAEISDLKIKQVPLSTVTLTVPAQDIGGFGYRQFVEIFDAGGSRVDIFRVTRKPSGKAGGPVKLCCDQALCTLKDDIVPGYVQLGGTTQSLRGAIESVLGYQRIRRWTLARCEYDTHFEYGLSDENLLSALLMLVEPLEDAMIVTDTATTPWQLSIVRLTDEDASELRYSRNLTEIDEVIEDDDFATRLYPRGYGEGVNQLGIRDVNGGVEYIEAPQAVRDLWGTVSKPYVDTTCTDAQTLLAKARAVLALSQHPQVSYKVKGVDLHLLTNEPMDAFYAGRMARVIYTEYGIAIRARVIEICYPQPIARPGEVNLTISSQSASVATVIAELSRKSAINELYGQGSTFIYADSIEQNADQDTPAEGDIYLPETMVHVNAVMLKVTLSAYRADSKGAAGGGGTVQTTQMGGGSQQTSESAGQTVVTVETRTATQTLHTGNPLVEGVAKNETGYALNADGTHKSYTAAATGSTSASGEQNTGVSRNGDGAMSSTGTGGPTSTGTGGPSSVGAAQGSGGAMSTTGAWSGDSGESSGSTGSGGSGISVQTLSGNSGYTDGSGSHRHVISHTHALSGASHTHSLNSHSHSIPSHTHSMGHWHNLDTHSHTISQHSHSMSHWHTVDGHTHGLGGHTHEMDHRHEFAHAHLVVVSAVVPGQEINIEGHRHTVTVPSHSHEITLADHEHSIVYGIFKGPRASEFVVFVDGQAVPASAFDSQGIADIAPYLGTDSSGKITRGAFHTLSVRPVATDANPEGLCRIRASWSAQVFISSLVGRQY